MKHAARCLQVEADERDRRRDALVSLQQKIGEHWAKKLVGKEIQVLVDGPDEDGCIVGRTQHDAPDIDNQVLLSDSADASVPRLATGQMRTCLVSLFFQLLPSFTVKDSSGSQYLPTCLACHEIHFCCAGDTEPYV